MFPWESPGGSPRRERRWRDQATPQSSFDTPDHAAAQGGPLDRPSEATGQGGPLEKEDIRQGGMQDKRQASISQDTPKAVAEPQPVPRRDHNSSENQAQDQFKSSQDPAQATVVTPTTPAAMAHVPPPESTPVQPGPPRPQQSYGIQPVPLQTNIPPQVGAQPYAPQSYIPQYQPAPFALPANQNPPQSHPYQPQYQSPGGFQPSPQTPHVSSLERLEMTKMKAEMELQQSQLMEYQVAGDHQEQQKTRLEDEVKELVKKVQEMEGAKQKKDLDAASKVSELEGKVRTVALSSKGAVTWCNSYLIFF